MEIDAELRRQITVSMLAAAVFIIGLVALGMTYGEPDGLPEEGAAGHADTPEATDATE